MASKHLYVIAWLFVVGSGPSFGTEVPSVAPYVYRPNEEKLALIESLSAPWAQVRRWLIEYETIPSAVSTDSVPVHRIMAVSALGGLYSLAAHFPQDTPWQMDFFCQEYFIHDQKTCHRWPFNRTYAESTIQLGDYVPGSIWMDALLTIIPNWPLTAYKLRSDPKSGRPVLLPDVLRSADCRLRASSEIVGNESCVVFDYGASDQLWIASAKGLCLMRHDIRNSHSKRLLQRIDTDKVLQVGPELWLPGEYRIQFFREGENTNEVRLERENRIHILRCLLNGEVPDSTFIPIQPAGSLRYEGQQHFTQVVPGGEDLLDEFVHFMIKYGRLPTQPLHKARPHLWLLLGVVPGLCVGVFALQLNRRGLGKSTRACEPGLHTR